MPQDTGHPDRGAMDPPNHNMAQFRDECLALLVHIQDFRTGSLIEHIITYDLLPIVTTTLTLQALLEKFVLDNPGEPFQGAAATPPG